jgi:colanic acid biosynthesis protein WcaH
MASSEDFLHVVRCAPLVSMDLIVRDGHGRVLVGLRRNRPAQGWWFVPGGVVRKDERFEQAFARITQAELGWAGQLDAARSLGAWEHLYPDNFAGDPGFGTHYVVLAWELALPPHAPSPPQEQHRDYRWVSVEALGTAEDVHPYSRAYASALAR